MNCDFVDIEANAVPVGNQLPIPTLSPNAPQAIVQDAFANGAPVPSDKNNMPLERSLAESANAPTVEQANLTPTGQVVLVEPALPQNRADKQEKVPVVESENGSLPLLHEAVPVPNDPVPTVHGVGQQEQKVAESSTAFTPQENACAPPTSSVDVSPAENNAAVSQEGGAPEGIVAPSAQEPIVVANNPVPVVDIENLQPAVIEDPVAIVREAGRPVENGPSLLELIRALPEQLHELLVNGTLLLPEQEMEEPPQRFFIVTTPKQERNGANTGAQAPIPAENVVEPVQAIAEPEVANEVPAVNVGNDVGDQAPPEPIVLPEEVRADELQDAPEQQAILLPYNPNIQADESFIRRFAENTARYRHNDGRDFEVYSDSLGLQRNTEYTLDARLKRNLRQLGVTQKRKVQQHLVPTILAHQNAVVQTESGSGKTLAYAVPVIQLAMNRTHFRRGPLAVVLVPSREECHRIAKLFLALASGTGVNVAFSYGETDFRTARHRLREGCDILICTSSRFAHHLHENQIVLSDLRTIVVDCAEIMIDDTHTRSTLLDLLDVRQMKLQVVLITTTYNTNITSLYARRLEPVMDISSGHSLNSRVRVSTVALQTLWLRGVHAITRIINDPSVHQIIIFLSHNDSCRRLYGRLQNNPEVEEYKNSMQYITTGGSQEQRDQTIEYFYHNQFKVLITTDVFALGLDFPDVDRVISFDIPSSSQLLTHRCGRTGRIVAGEATVLFDELSSKKKEEAEILRTFLSQSQKDIPECLKHI